MKTSDSMRLRLSCVVVEKWSALIDEGGADRENSWVARHRQTCPVCREAHGEDEALMTALRTGAAGMTAEGPAGLDTRIRSAVARSVQEAPQKKSPVGLLSLAGVAAALALVYGALSPAVESRDRVVATSLDAGRAGSRSAAYGTELPGERGLPLPEALLAGEPLRNEVNAVYADARAALGFLALNFLPSSSDQASDG